ncbi:Cytochrome c [Roseivivax sp. THAF40]|uniref:c-type cytochrome n=1 Tax=Roseivivax sp. THAF40 TaxID=2587858 RepID=UPI00126975A8|nr:cytochrome c [Roseivivax sp. THAF40]QFT45383.1 Cytochrome c [Roseivivax sp. THAF40]
MRRWIAASVGLACAAGLAAAAMTFGRPGAEAMRLRPNDQEEVALGRSIYAEACAACHGVQLQGQPDWQTPGPDGTLPAPPHDETGHTWHHPDKMLFTLTRDGLGALLGDDSSYISGMPAFAGQLTDAEIRATLSYIKSTWPDDIRARHDQINAQAAAR